MPEIFDLEDLRARLESPSSILCLGNGPSSEGPQIPKDCDSLFRVNWIWQDRKFMAEPDLVFTGDPDLPPPGSRAIVAFPTRGEAERIMKAYPKPVDWLVVPRLLHDFPTYKDVPTNGALMIAVAVALAPRRLVVSGIDLYSHPEGKYPGVADDPAGYDSAHSRETDIACIRDALWRHKGQLTILSPALKRALISEIPD